MLKPISLETDVRLKLSQKIDKKLLKERKSAGQKLTYISANTCIDILNSIFGHNWSMRIVDHWMEPGYDQVIKEQLDFKTKAKKWPNGINPPEDKIQVDGAGNRYVTVPQLPTAWCIVEIEVNLVDEQGNMHKIVKQGFGSQAIIGGQSTQAQNGYKGAQSDAIKKAATLLGVALELYRDESEARAFDEIINELVDTWGKPGMKEQYKDTWSAYTKVRDAYGWSDEDVSYYVELITGGAVSDINDLPVELTEQLLDAIESDNEEGDE